MTAAAISSELLGQALDQEDLRGKTADRCFSFFHFFDIDRIQLDTPARCSKRPCDPARSLAGSEAASSLARLPKSSNDFFCQKVLVPGHVVFQIFCVVALARDPIPSMSTSRVRVLTDHPP
ncbi:uncharacterized protein ARMOST_00294 [Armillaria ostoyae]|uniref:Uncharacterized protein n=1 Tax=Armillaria ostoyae TaxID=47428 RepID=A0A284QKP2_ARMOS|nr:uncharacterized protein ARMOST_00294 [Armillaria ostoyae]